MNPEQRRQQNMPRAMPFTKRKHPPRIVRPIGGMNRVAPDSGMMTPGALNETYRNYILQEGTVSAEDRGFKKQMLDPKYRGKPDGPPLPGPGGAPSGGASASASSGGASAGGEVRVRNKTIDTNIGIEEYYVHLDSMNIDDAGSPNQGNYLFPLPAIGTSSTRNNIISIRVNEFYIPNINELLPNPNDRIDFFFYRKVYLRFRNISAETAHQSTGSSLSYHYEFYVNEPTGTAVLLTPVQPLLRFTRVINNLDTIDVALYVPRLSPFNDTLLRIPLPRTRITARVTNAPIGEFTIIDGNVGRDIWGVAGAIPGDGLAIAARYTGSQEIDTPFRTGMESENGERFITNVDTATGTFIVNQNGAAGNPNADPPVPNNGNTYEIVIHRNRVLMNVNFATIIEGQKTNYMLPSRAL